MCQCGCQTGGKTGIRSAAFLRSFCPEHAVGLFNPHTQSESLRTQTVWTSSSTCSPISVRGGHTGAALLCCLTSMSVTVSPPPSQSLVPKTDIVLFIDMKLSTPHPSHNPCTCSRWSVCLLISFAPNKTFASLMCSCQAGPHKGQTVQPGQVTRVDGLDSTGQEMY